MNEQTKKGSLKTNLDLAKVGQQLTDQYGFLGVPANTFEQAGRNQFVTLIEEGLMPHSKVLEIGCGVLRVGYWLIHFLDENGYCGIEPSKRRVEIGQNHLLSKEVLEIKKPRFDFNEKFDTSVFDQKFDFFLAGSIWTHCSKRSIEVMLDGFVDNTSENGVFLVSYLPSRKESQDYQGTEWVGTSHVSSSSGCVKHSRKWIEAQCHQRGLFIEQLPQDAFDSQYWLVVSRQKRQSVFWPRLRKRLGRIRQSFKF